MRDDGRSIDFALGVMIAVLLCILAVVVAFFLFLFLSIGGSCA
jgi:hypothetical protein